MCHQQKLTMVKGVDRLTEPVEAMLFISRSATLIWNMLKVFTLKISPNKRSQLFQFIYNYQKLKKIIHLHLIIYETYNLWIIHTCIHLPSFTHLFFLSFKALFWLCNLLESGSLFVLSCGTTNKNTWKFDLSNRKY